MTGGFGRALRAYPTLLRVGFAAAVAYRAEMVVWMLTTTMPLVSLALWSAVSADAPIGRFTQARFAAYFLGTLVVRQLTGSWVVWEMNQEIRTGTVAQRLLKPVHPLVAYSAENLSAVPLRALVSLPFTLLALAQVNASDRPHTVMRLAAVVLSFVGAWAINFLTMATIGSLAFFIESSTAVFDVWLVLFMLLSGYLVPIELLPAGLRVATALLPFRYTLAFPAELLTGTPSDAAVVRDLSAQWAYVAAMLVAALLSWRAGLRRFAAYGG